MLKVKTFRGSHASTKILYLEFFISEIFSVEKFPVYNCLSNATDPETINKVKEANSTTVPQAI